MPDYFVHESAYVDDGAQIGTATKIWHFCHIMPKAVLGASCSLGQNVFVANDVVIGSGCKIQNNVSIYSGVTLEADVFCGPSMVFTNVINPRSAVPRNTTADYAKTYVKRGVTIGANATIVCGVTLGAYAFIAAGAVVTQDVPDYALMMGVPAVQKGWMSAHGERLEFDSTGLARDSTGTVYKLQGDMVRPESAN